MKKLITLFVATYMAASLLGSFKSINLQNFETNSFNKESKVIQVFNTTQHLSI